jgi:N-acetylglutamate synthase-like GNAT family acetyltransferase
MTEIIVRRLAENDISTADCVYRLAFGTFVGLHDPIQFSGDADPIGTRFRANPSAALAAEVNGELVGSNFMADWGSVGFFGPLSVHPDLWNKGVAKHLLKSTMEYFAKLGTRHIGLFTLANSPKHVGLYQRFGFWPHFLTAIMVKQLVNHDEKKTSMQWSKYSNLRDEDRRECLNSCYRLTNSIYDGLDVQFEINSVNMQNLGDTILLWQNGNDLDDVEQRLIGLAVCHCGAGTEAGSGSCYIKFGAVLPGDNTQIFFDSLLHACETFAKEQQMCRLIAGVNTARHDAYQMMISLGFRTQIQGVVMDNPNEFCYNKPDIYLIDDWR